MGRARRRWALALLCAALLLVPTGAVAQDDTAAPPDAAEVVAPPDEAAVVDQAAIDDQATDVAPDAQPAPAVADGHTYYASTYHTGAGASFNAHTIYCDTDPGWKRLSPANLASFPSLDAAMAALPGYLLHRPC